MCALGAHASLLATNRVPTQAASAPETHLVMKEVKEVTAKYLPIAQACSAIFFILEQLNLVNHFYRLSLGFFLDIFDYVLHHNPNLRNVTDYGKRREILLSDL